MTLSLRACNIALCISTVMILGAAGCKGDGVQASGSGSGADLSGPPTFNEEFQTRNPRVCTKVTSPPNVSQATAMVQCDHESASATGGSSPVFLLVTDLQVQMGASRAYTPDDSYWQDIDPSAKIYPLRGQSTAWACSPVNSINAGKNCLEYPGVPLGTGRCWYTLFKEWHCSMTTGGPNTVMNVKGPTVY